MFLVVESKKGAAPTHHQSKVSQHKTLSLSLKILFRKTRTLSSPHPLIPRKKKEERRKKNRAAGEETETETEKKEGRKGLDLIRTAVICAPNFLYDSPKTAFPTKGPSNHPTAPEPAVAKPKRRNGSNPGTVPPSASRSCCERIDIPAAVVAKDVQADAARL